MARTWLYAGASLAVVGSALFQVYIRSPTLEANGIYRELHPVNHKNCQSIPELKACEKIRIMPSGVMYLACGGTIESRFTWMPTLDALNATSVLNRSAQDYLATYDTKTGAITRLTINGLTDPRGLNLHGMDVVPDETNPNTLWIYLVNHRPELDSALKGANSVIEILKTQAGADHVEWVRTVENAQVVVTPNDIVGGSNGQEFWFTNDNGSKVGLRRHIDLMFRLKTTFVGYCHVTDGCKRASVPLLGSNGQITIHKPNKDKTLEHVGTIATEFPMDNLALSTDGSIIAAAFPKLHLAIDSAINSSVSVPSAVLRISDATLGSAYKVEKIYEDEGQLGSFGTTAAMHGDTLFIHGRFYQVASNYGLSPLADSENTYLRAHGSSDACLQDPPAKLSLIDLLGLKKN
ncbi:hypothetical protein RSOLAG1IB_04301 [Rhizoctonia solani AG-1 IB]|uniref:Serum paraoxonase/arylesterase n=1 Tax=Thanatephorus cucumeris (strain AG1-IB / isolate 7/3/14) TaxID=1108050 RepID=A0A0B7FT19_THACB|nr:hypothetical protein RSOLAG1IB_04301 [Rhizoctonia solani AG-1 IB]